MKTVAAAVALPDMARIAAVAHEAAGAAARETLARFRAAGAVEDKGGGDGYDPVTEADRAAEAALRAVIAAHYRNHGVVGEELAATGLTADWVWTLDPIDGTRAYIAGVPTWTTLVAFGPRGGAPVFGLIDQPYLGERYWGGPEGARARLRNKEIPLRARACAGLDRAAAACTDRIALFEAGAEREGVSALFDAVRFVRGGLDAYGYARLASGDLDLVVEAGLKPVDVAALIPVVRGAGGVITDWRGGEAGTGGRVLACGDARLHAEALERLRRL